MKRGQTANGYDVVGETEIALNGSFAHVRPVTASYSLSRDCIAPPVSDPEIALFTFMLQSATARKSLESVGIHLPERFDLTHNTSPDDPPDLRALGHGWECTCFPKSQRPQNVVHRQSRKEVMVVAPYAVTRGDIGKMYRGTDYSGYDMVGHSYEQEIAALENDFLSDVLASKDVPGNDVLLLDGRLDLVPDRAESAIRKALQKVRPQRIKLILLVGRDLSVTDRNAPRVVQMYP